MQEITPTWIPSIAQCFLLPKLKAYCTQHLEKIKCLPLASQRSFDKNILNTLITSFDNGYCEGFFDVAMAAFDISCENHTIQEDLHLYTAYVEQIHRPHDFPAIHNLRWFYKVAFMLVTWDGTSEFSEIQKKNIEEFISFINYYQWPNPYTSKAQGKLPSLFVDDKNRQLNKEYHITGLVTQAQTAEIIKDVVYPEKWHRCSSHNHATGFRLFNNHYYFFGPNSGNGFVPFPSAETLASAIFNEMQYPNRQTAPLGIEAFSIRKENEIKTIYPDEKALLTKLGPPGTCTVANLFHNGLTMASKVGDINAISYYQETNQLTTFNYKDNDQNTAILLAAGSGEVEVVKGLLKLNVNANIKNSKNMTALSCAVLARNLNIIDALLKYTYLNKKGKAVLVQLNVKNIDGMTPVMVAASKGYDDVIALLTRSNYKRNNKRKIKLDIQNNLGDTALILATARGHTSCILQLLALGSEPNIANAEGSTPLTWAAELGMTEAVRALLKHNANPNAIVKNGDNSLRFAVLYKHPEILEVFLSFINENTLFLIPRVEIILAAYRGDTARAVFLLNNFSTQIPQIDKNTALFSAIYSKKIDTINFLLQEKAEITSIDIFGHDALCLSIFSNDLKVFEAVLQHALLTIRGYPGVAFLEIIYKQDYATIRNAIACYNPIKPSLHQKYLDAALCLAVSMNDTTMVDILLTHPSIDVTIENTERHSLLFMATKQGNRDIVKSLLIADKRKVRDPRGTDGLNALMVACADNQLEILILLLHFRPNLNVADHDNMTPLMYAAENGHQTIVELLIQEGAAIDLKNNENRTAEQLAIAQGHQDIADLLMSHRLSKQATLRPAETLEPSSSNISSSITFFNKRKMDTEEESAEDENPEIEEGQDMPVVKRQRCHGSSTKKIYRYNSTS